MTVVFNGAPTLESAISSVLRQHGADYEYIVIDGGSTDGSVDIIERYQDRLSFWISEPDNGIYDAFNKGIAAARGEWIYFLGADDRLAGETVLARMADRLSRLEETVGLAYGKVSLLNMQGAPVGVIGEPWETARRSAGKGMFVPHQGLFQRRSWFERHGGFDTSYRIAGDYEMMLRGWGQESVEFVPDLVVACMTHGGVSTSPSNALHHLREVARAQATHDWPFQWRLAMAFCRTYIRLGLSTVCGERMTMLLLDAGRRVMGKKSHWTKT